jgi:hypothetical protein
MATKDKKQRHAKKRKEIQRRKKAKRISLPDLLRKEPLLQEALNYRHPLVSCLINKDWDQAMMATIFLFRQASTGLVLSCFHVDLAGFGLKDAWGNYGLTEADLEEIKSRGAEKGPPLIPCELSLASTIVYGGIAWAEKWGFKLPKDYKIWLRLLEPVDKTGINLSLFGEDGKPLLVLNEDGEDSFAGEYLYPKILKAKLETGKEGIPRETLSLMGDIKSALIAFSRQPEFSEELETALKSQFGKPKRPDSEDEWVSFQDWFILQYRLEDGGTVAGLFVENYKHAMSKDVRDLILGWRDVIEGFFEVKDRKAPGLHLKNLINEREYQVFPTASMVDYEIKPGDFLSARIVPAKGFHIFSGAVTIIEWDGSDDHRAAMYKSAMDFQMKHPGMAFTDNKEKLQKSYESARKHFEDFVHHFGSDEVFGTGPEILHKYQGFFDYLSFEKKDPETGNQPVAQAFEKKTGKPYQRIIVKLPEPVLNSRDIGMLCDPVKGLSFLIDYRRFIEVFQYPDQHLGKKETEEIVMGYLESGSISDAPFRRMATRFPHNFTRVMSYYRNQKGFSSIKIDDLMAEFKPDSLNRLPGIVTILDDEMARLARSAKEEPASIAGRFKGLFKRKEKI